jgi:hypothetical protein
MPRAARASGPGDKPGPFLFALNWPFVNQRQRAFVLQGAIPVKANARRARSEHRSFPDVDRNKAQQTGPQTHGVVMKKLVFVLAAAAALGVAAPASAQVVFGAGPGGFGVGVGVGPGYNGPGPYYGGYGYGGYGYRGYGYGPSVSYYEPACRVVRMRTRTPSGRIVVRTREVCD